MNTILNAINLKSKLILLMICPLLAYLIVAIGFISENYTKYNDYGKMKIDIQKKAELSKEDQINLLFMKQNEKIDYIKIIDQRIESSYNKFIVSSIMAVVILILCFYFLLLF